MDVSAGLHQISGGSRHSTASPAFPHRERSLLALVVTAGDIDRGSLALDIWGLLGAFLVKSTKL
jgi:hypothetical protein